MTIPTEPDAGARAAPPPDAEPRGASSAVSVVIPSYNTAAYIGETLDSVVRQTLQPLEIIVVNDGSPDTPELEQVLKPYRARIRYHKQENRGISGARNTGIRLARGDYVAFLDSDDAWEPDFLRTLVGLLEADPSVDIVFPDVVMFGDTRYDGTRKSRLQPLKGEITFERLVADEVYVFTSVVARREVIERAGLYDETLRRAEDFELWLRVTHGGGRIAYCPQPLARYRQRPQSLTSDADLMIEQQLAMFSRVRDSLPLTGEQRSLVLRREERIRAGRRLREAKRALARGDTTEALLAVEEANTALGARKLRWIAHMLRVAPGMTRRAYRWRERFLGGADSSRG